MTSQPYIALPRCYDDLLATLLGQMDKLGIGINQLDEICGFARGYSSKIYGPSKTRLLGIADKRNSLWVTLSELGLRLALVEDTDLLAKRRLPARPHVKYKAHFNANASDISIHVMKRAAVCSIGSARAHRWKGKTKAQRSAHARLMALARWKPAAAASV